VRVLERERKYLKEKLAWQEGREGFKRERERECVCVCVVCGVRACVCVRVRAYQLFIIISNQLIKYACL
jgi:hypothetical protein